MQANYETGNWEEFKKEIYALYLGSTGDRKYSVANLETLTEKQATCLWNRQRNSANTIAPSQKSPLFSRRKTNSLTARLVHNLFRDSITLSGLKYAPSSRPRAQHTTQMTHIHFKKS